MRNVTATGFQFQIDEWDYLEGTHGQETIAWFAVERGEHDLGGITVEAGSYDQLTNKWRTVEFGAGFASVPIVLHQLVTANDPAAAIVRLRSLTSLSFQAKIREEEAADGVHGAEVMHYVALSTGTGTVNGKSFAVGNTGITIDSNWRTVTVGGNYLAPLLLASPQTHEGGDPVTLRHRNLLPTQFEIFMEEEKSNDSETGHNTEAVGWVVISNP